MKIAVYTICKNEEQFAERFMQCIKDEADGIYVADTGSSDRTVEILRDYGAIVNVIDVQPWRFDVPRNASLAFVPANVDACICIDLDETLTPGWRDALEKAWTPTTTRMRYMYAWSHNEDGSPGVSFWYDKVHQRKNYRWVKPVHEILQIYNQQEVQTQCSGFMLHHYPDPTKSRGSYLGLLEMGCREEPDDDRNCHYLGREYMYYGMHDKSIAELQRHLSLKSATWKAERAASMRYISRCYLSKKDVQSAVEWALKSVAEAPGEREPLLDLAKAAYAARDFTTCYFAAKKAIEIKERPASYICEPAAWGHEPWDYLSIGAWNLGHKREALEAGKEAFRLNPKDKRLEENVNLIEKELKSKSKKERA